MRYQGINANILSLGGIAIAIGAMVDAAVVMIENAHKKIETWHRQHPGQELRGDEHWQVIADAAVEVGPALFFCLVIITLSFIPIFSLQAQEGRLFAPLAFTKTYAMAAAAGLSVTLVPVLMGFWIRGKLPDEQRNPLNRALIRIYRPVLDAVLARPALTLSLAALVLLSALWPISRLGGEFLPALDEGDLLYMPSALPGLSAQKASELLQQTDRMIRTVPEVARVFGKAGRAETATDPAPLEMFETTVQFKPRDRVARGHDARKTGRGAGPRGAGAGTDQPVDTANPQPHRHAGHRHQESHRRENRRRTRWRRSTAWRGTSSASPAQCPVSPPRSPSDSPAAAMSISTSIARRRRDTASALPTCSRSSPAWSAARTSARPWRAWRASRSTCATRASGATPWSAWRTCRC